MTRLTDTHIQETADQLKHIDHQLGKRVNTGLLGVALKTIGISENAMEGHHIVKSVAVVPISTGKGIIPGFTETVCAIVRHVGLDAWVTRSSDVAGISEAFSSTANVMLLADDDDFVAINLETRQMVHNDRATGESFAVLLKMMTPNDTRHSFGVLGCGPVGSAAALRLAQMGVDLVVCDHNAELAQRLVSRIHRIFGIKITQASEASAVFATCRGILDATPSSDIVSPDLIGPYTVITAPGVPIGLPPEAVKQMEHRFYHDNLPLGLATMVFAAVFNRLI